MLQGFWIYLLPRPTFYPLQMAPNASQHSPKIIQFLVQNYPHTKTSTPPNEKKDQI